MTVSAALDSAGRRRSPATLPGYHAGRPPRNKGMLYPADPVGCRNRVGLYAAWLYSWINPPSRSLR
jgi:hypothetical protein